MAGFKQWDRIDEECEREGNAIAAFNRLGVRPNIVGPRTAKVRRSHRKQQPTSSRVILANAERRTGLSHEIVSFG